jgi:DNA-binding transcriptional LysR family regulator
MDIQLYKTFLTVVKLGNISQAAEKLNFTQPAITAQMQTLERYFGVLLFERIGKKLFLTEAGRCLIEYAERMLSITAEAQEAMAPFREKRHSITLGISTQMINYLLPPVLSSLQSRLPGVQVSVEVCRNIDEVLHRLAENHFDIGIIHDHLASQPLLQYGFWTEDIIWVGSSKLLHQYDSPDFLQLPIINFKRPGSVFRAKFDEVMKDKSVSSAIEYSDSEAVKRAVLNGLGISYLPKVLIQHHIESGHLIQLDQAPKMQLRISVIFHKNKTVTSPIYHFLSVLSELPEADAALKEFLALFNK